MSNTSYRRVKFADTVLLCIVNCRWYSYQTRISLLNYAGVCASISYNK